MQYLLVLILRSGYPFHHGSVLICEVVLFIQFREVVAMNFVVVILHLGVSAVVALNPKFWFIKIELISHTTKQHFINWNQISGSILSRSLCLIHHTVPSIIKLFVSLYSLGICRCPYAMPHHRFKWIEFFKESSLEAALEVVIDVCLLDVPWGVD